MTDEFVRSSLEFIQEEEELDLVRFAKGQRKDEVVQERLREFQKSGRTEGVLLSGWPRKRRGCRAPSARRWARAAPLRFTR